MTPTTARWLLLLSFAAAACRGKDNAPTAAGSAARGPATAATTPGTKWSVTIDAGEGTGLLNVASGARGSVVAIARSSGTPITVNGAHVVKASEDVGDALIELDATGAPTSGSLLQVGSQVPALVVSTTEVLVGVREVSAGEKGAIASLPDGGRVPVDGNVVSLARTANGDLWIAGSNWGDPLGGGECDRKPFIARAAAGGAVNVVACGGSWRDMQLAAAGEDVVLCASQHMTEVKIGATKLQAKSFIARIAADSSVRWARAINEIGDSSCEAIVVSSDGDVVATGTSVDDADFTEGAIAKGAKARPNPGGSSGSALWLARYSQDGTRRWARMVSHVIRGDHPSLAADGDGNAVLAAAVMDPLELGHGPIGPDGGVIVAAIDRDAKVPGMIVARGGAYRVRAAVDGANGVVMGFATREPVTVAGMSIEPPRGKTIAAVVRVPLPLPAP